MFPVPTQGLMGAMSGADISAGIALALDFINGATSLDRRITFSRTSNATLTDSNGRVSYAPHNLLTNSEDFEAAAWVKTNATITANSAVAPDGTTTADSLIPTAASTTGRAIQLFTGIAGTTYTLSVYGKAGAFNSIRVYADDAATNIASVRYNLSTGAVITAAITTGTWTAASSTIDSVGNGWYRLTLAWTATGAAPTRYGVWCETSGDGTSGIFIWGAQLNVANAPVNLLTFSEQFDNNAVWIKTNATVTANDVIAPNGTTTADTITDNATNGFHRAQQNSTFVAGVVYTLSVYAKQGTTGIALVLNDSSVNFGRASFDLVAGTPTLITGTSANIEPVGNGWFRCSITATATASGNGQAAVHVKSVFTYVGTGEYAYIWGAQLNTGSTALPYVATTSSIYLPPSYNSTTPKNLLGFTQEFDNAAWTKSNSFVQTNLLTWSEQFDNAAWNASTGSVTPNSVVAPNGTTTADVFTGSGADSYIRQTLACLTADYTYSIYLKVPSGSASIGLYLISGNGSTVAGSLTASVTTSWQRFTVTGSLTAGASARVQIGGASTIGVGTVVELWGAQLVQGSVPGDYQVTTSAAAAVQYSDPNGTRTADLLVSTAGGSLIRWAGQTVTPQAGASYAFSFYAKADTHNFIQLLNNGTGSAFANFDLQQGVTGTRGGNTTSSISNIGNGWYRCTAVFDTGASLGSGFRVYLVPSASSAYAATLTASGTESVFLWGAQLSNSASVDPYAYNPQAAPTSTAYYGPRFDYNPTGTPVLGSELVTNGTFDTNLSGWTLSQTVTASLPSWSSGAMKLLSDGTGFSIADQSITTVAGVTYQFSLFVTYPGSGTLDVRAGTTQGASDLLASTNISAGGTFTYTFVATGTTSWIRIRTGSNNATGYLVDNVSVQAVTGYTATANGLLIEEQRTNLLTYSEDFSNAAWGAAGGAKNVTASTAVTPAGTQNAWVLTDNSTANFEGMSRPGIAVANDNSSYLISIYVLKTNGGTSTTFGINASLTGGTSVNQTSRINTDTGAVISGVGTVTNAGAWWRVSVTITNNTTGNTSISFSVYPATAAYNSASDTATATGSATIWGAQLEAGSFATSYIPTVASQVTRAADNASMLGDNFATWFTASQGTFYAQFDVAATTTALGMVITSADNGATNGYLFYKASLAANLTTYAGANNASVGNLTVNTVAKSALAYDGTNNAGVLNGASPVAITATAVTTPTQFLLGRSYGGNQLSGHIRSISYYPTRLPNATLQSITT